MEAGTNCSLMSIPKCIAKLFGKKPRTDEPVLAQAEPAEESAPKTVLVNPRAREHPDIRQVQWAQGI